MVKIVPVLPIFSLVNWSMAMEEVDTKASVPSSSKSEENGDGDLDSKRHKEAANLAKLSDDHGERSSQRRLSAAADDDDKILRMAGAFKTILEVCGCQLTIRDWDGDGDGIIMVMAAMAMAMVMVMVTAALAMLIEMMSH